MVFHYMKDLVGGRPHTKIKRSIRALLHQGEFVLPLNVPPTRKQIMAVKKRHGKWIKYPKQLK